MMITLCPYPLGCGSFALTSFTDGEYPLATHIEHTTAVHTLVTPVTVDNVELSELIENRHNDS